MNIEQARFNMVEQQIRTWEVLDQNVLDLLFIVKREEFVPAACRNLAFADAELPLGHGVRMLAPKIEAHALQSVQLKPHEKVLEIGSGSGYMAALLGAHADHVWSVEINPQIAEMARNNILRLGISNVSIDIGNGFADNCAAADHGPFDVIMLSGGVTVVPQELLARLKIGGRLFAIVGEEPLMTARVITRLSDKSFGTVDIFETQADLLLLCPTPNRFVF